MRIVMAGSSGFLGTRLRERLVGEGHDVVQLVRRSPDRPDQLRWSPDRGEVDAGALTDADAVVNLAGAGVEDRRWTAAYKQVLISSRVDTTRTLATALAGLPEGRRPALLNASGVHFYGHPGETTVTEDTPAGGGFLSRLCQAWEAATASAENAGVRVVHLRTGLVLDGNGGLLKRLLLPYRFGAGGRLADGRQWMPWISLRDWLSSVTFLLARDDVAGAVNLVGPAPVRNADFTRSLAAALHRPAVVPVPRFALRIALGEFADEALASQRALPKRLTDAGFSFADGDLDSALRSALGRG